MLFHNQGGYYNSLLLQALELLPGRGERDNCDLKAGRPLDSRIIKKRINSQKSCNNLAKACLPFSLKEWVVTTKYPPLLSFQVHVRIYKPSHILPSHWDDVSPISPKLCSYTYTWISDRRSVKLRKCVSF